MYHVILVNLVYHYIFKLVSSRLHSSTLVTPTRNMHEEGEGAVEPPAVHPLHPPEATATVSAVNMKLPPFWPTDPEMWFAQVEAQFSTCNIRVQRTKFDHIVASLTPEFAMEVRDLILHPPAVSPYDLLKQQLIKRTTASE